MLSGLKFIPREQIDKAKDENSDDSKKERRKPGRRKEKHRRKKKTSRYSSSDDEGFEKIKSGSRKKKKWYASDEDLSSNSDESRSDDDSEIDHKKRKSLKREKKKHDGSSQDEHRGQSKKKTESRKKQYLSEDGSPYDSRSANSSEERRHHKGEKGSRKKDKKRGDEDDTIDSDLYDDGEGSLSQNYSNIVRKEMGLDWMLRPKDNTEKTSDKASDMLLEEASTEEVKKVNPRELNPYLKDNGSGYPEESDQVKSGSHLLSTAAVGDGGASWRLKALKRAQEQAAREGRKLEEVVEERWGSMGQFAASVASRTVAPTHAHLHAIRNRKKELIEEERAIINNENNSSVEKNSDRKSTVDVTQHSRMRVPKVRDSLSWGKRRNQSMSTQDSALVSAAMSGLNRFDNDGSFMHKIVHQKNDNSVDLSNSSHTKSEEREEPKSVGYKSEESKEDASIVKPAVSANQLAAKALQLRMKGKHEEAEKLMKEAEKIKATRVAGNESSRPQIDGTTSRYIMNDVSARQKKKEEDADLNLAQTIMCNHQYSKSRQADDEYDYDDGPRKKTRKKGGGGNHKSSEISNSANRFFTQQERCQFCFENPTRPKHLVVAIANFTYLSLPQMQPVVPGHCCILTLQHESCTRSVDDNVWDEIRNFKKCLIMMFKNQEKDVVFLETVMGLAQQRRHCLVECIPVPQEIAKQAPVYFKKAIDEAEDEWSQHNAKKLIDTSEKGLRGSIPKNFPYFHVEFGLQRGFVHVIDDEKEFKSSFGLNVIRGMLRLPAEDMHRRRKHESMETQKQAVASFARDWEPFDWTKQLD
ncbi:CWF19-like protein 2 [Olea europaea var. sylvestris]|uniref:CWF19-like protein 2 n=1 Tax=Olea europaea var. sylvestris TaxID=158386 RepID=UPI000C1D2760|nr:CWF19-like protein 2 [Olea europaea var. sylvestris]XP_022851474.1 CWF19-like protein 2 [Olea europaea var. sylvestris]